METEFEFSGGRLCLDFANARRALSKGDPRRRYASLLRWSQLAGSVSEQQTRRLAGAAARRPAEAKAVVERAGHLGEAINGIFTSLAAGRQPASAAVGVLNAELARAMSEARLVPTNGGFSWGWSRTKAPLESVLWPVARSAADLLVSEEIVSVKVCSDATCLDLFVDATKNHRRRWCDMKVCGNRAKVRRFRARQRAEPMESASPGKRAGQGRRD